MFFVIGVIVFIIGVLAIMGRRESSYRAQRVGASITLLIGGIIMLFSILVVVPAGHVGIQVLFGKVYEEPLESGLHIVNPFLSIEHMSVRTDVYTMAASQNVQQGEVISALSKDGLRMPLDVTVAYKLTNKDASWVYKHIGENYVEKIIVPVVRTGVRDATARFNAQEAYSTHREVLAVEIKKNIIARLKNLLAEYKEFSGTAFEIQEVLLRNVELPPKVKEAIEEKLRAEQESLRMDFVLEKERKEASRKQIEAQGIQKFQEIVNRGIDDRLLRWKGIEATEKLATSPNTKVIVIGSGKDGLPIILGPDK